MSCGSRLLDLFYIAVSAAAGVAVLDHLICAWWSARVQRQQDRDGEKAGAGAGVAEKPGTKREGAADQGAGDAK